jgi:hypothetical protein
MIIPFALLGIFPITSIAQWIEIPWTAPNTAFDAFILINVVNPFDAYISESVAVSGTNIAVQMSHYNSELPSTEVLTNGRYFASNLSLPEGSYSISVQLASYGSTNVVTRNFSVPHTGDPIGDPDFSNPRTFYGVDPLFIRTSNTFEYIHLQRNDIGSLDYIIQTRTNLNKGAWISLNADKTTNVLGGAYDMITLNIPTTNSQTYVRLIVE